MICIILRHGWDHMISAFSKILAVAYSLGMILGFIKKHGWVDCIIHVMSVQFSELYHLKKSQI